MRSSAEISIDLSTEELLQDALPVVQEEAGAMPQAPEAPRPDGKTRIEASGTDDEIELTPDQIDALLSKPL